MLKCSILEEHFLVKSLQFPSCFGGCKQEALWQAVLPWKRAVCFVQVVVTVAFYVSYDSCLVNYDWSPYRPRWGKIVSPVQERTFKNRILFTKSSLILFQSGSICDRSHVADLRPATTVFWNLLLNDQKKRMLLWRSYNTQSSPLHRTNPAALSLAPIRSEIFTNLIFICGTLPQSCLLIR